MNETNDLFVLQVLLHHGAVVALDQEQHKAFHQIVIAWEIEVYTVFSSPVYGAHSYTRAIMNLIALIDGIYLAMCLSFSFFLFSSQHEKDDSKTKKKKKAKTETCQ